MSFTVGSLFDGSGGFPLAGFLCGGVPVWAAEIEPYPIAVTRSRFPHMKHLGSVTDVKGNEIEPVDIITFGSPCQDLSVAGKRAGLKHEENGDDETTRSGLFMEAVRIIREMREATNGKYPRFALWENVPGAFSSNKGEDFRIVLEELIKVAEPTAVMPGVPQKGWAYADSYRGDGWSLAYRVFDAQYWGVPQRRRRIYLVADFGGERAREVLFERKGLRGYFTEGRTPWQTAPGDVESGTGTADSETDRINILTPWDSQGNQVTDGTGNNVYPCLRGCGGGGYQQGYVLQKMVDSETECVVPYTLKIRSGCEGGGKGALIQTDMSATLSTLNDQYLFQPLGFDTYNMVSTGDKTVTLRAGSEHNYAPVFQPTVFRADTGATGDAAPTLVGDHNNRVTDYTALVVEETLCMATGQANAEITKNISPTLNCASEQPILVKPEPIALDRAFFNQGANALYDPQLFEDGTCPTLVARGPAAVCVKYIVRRLTPTECARLQGFADRWGNIDHKDDFTDEEYAFWLNVRNTHAEINGKQVKDYTKAQMLTWYNKLHTDSSEYKLWGNGIALPNALYVMQGIADVYA